MGKAASVTAPTIDAGPAIEAFQTGADVIQQYFPQALAKFEVASGRATSNLIGSYGQAQQASAPYTDTAYQSMNELRSFMGIAPISKTIGFAGELQTLQDQMQNLPGESNFSTMLQQVQGLAEQAESATEPGARADFRTQIDQRLNQLSASADNAVRSAVNADKFMASAAYEERAPRTAAEHRLKRAGLWSSSQLKEGYEGVKPGTVTNDKGLFLGFEGLQEGQTAEDLGYYGYDEAGLGDVTGVGTMADLAMTGGMDEATRTKYVAMRQELEDVTPKIEALRQKYNSDYQDTPEKAMTGSQIQDKLEDLPEYQFQLGQGTKAMERSQAARGVLQSGNALVEAEQFGQGLAQNVYQGHLGRLAGLAGMNMSQVGASQNISGQLGTGVANQFNALGQAQQGSIQDVARSRESAFVREGQTLYDAAKTNASMQMQANMFNAQSQQQSGAGMGQLAGSLLGGFF